jgi:V/A-type H+-transporting ATPase subunit I
MQLQQAGEAQIKALDEQIHRFSFDWYETLEQGCLAALEAIDYENVVLNSEREVDDKLRLVEGWVPTENEQDINALLDSEGVWYDARRADREDPAPVKLSNNRFARLFHPITEMYDMPAYGETDLTPFFAPFFVMFFGLCLGDAGYGLLLALAGFIARAKVKPSMKPICSLVGILGIGTVIFGTISGTFFGISLIDAQWPWIQNLKKIMLTSNDLFYFSLIVGCVQILFGMLVKAVGSTIRFGLKSSFAAWGWPILLLGCGGAYALETYGLMSPETAKIVMYVTGGIGAVCIFLLNDLKRNPLFNVGAGVWDAYNMASGLLGDILSYVRLFALGISGAVLGLVFNDLAVKMSPDIPVVGFLVTLIILIFGHSMTFFMSALGAFVHPMRLTFVEFYKNAGFEGGGKKYRPFARRQKED